MKREEIAWYARSNGLLTESHKNILEYVEFFRDDYLLIKRRKMNIRVLGMNLFHNYLKRCDGDVQLLMEINELQIKLENVYLTKYVEKEIHRLLMEKIQQYEASRGITNYVYGIIEFEKVIEEYKEVDAILEHSEAIYLKIRTYNPTFNPRKYIDTYFKRAELPENPFHFNELLEMSKRPRKKLKHPKKTNGFFDPVKTEI